MVEEPNLRRLKTWHHHGKQACLLSYARGNMSEVWQLTENMNIMCNQLCTILDSKQECLA